VYVFVDTGILRLLAFTAELEVVGRLRMMNR